MSSVDRILTTHTGSLPRPGNLSTLIRQRENGELDDATVSRLPTVVEEAVATVVRRQVEAGIDIISDGEMSKIDSATYAKERLTGFDVVNAEVPDGGGLTIADLDDYPELAAKSLEGFEISRPVCVDDIQYTGADLLQLDLDNFDTAARGRSVEQRFMTAASPGLIAYYLPNNHYPTLDEYLFALAEAMRTEYEAIVNAGLTLQIDAPDLAGGRHLQYAHLSDDEFLQRVEVHVEAINHAVANIDPTKVRVHLCWGNYQGPHHHDIELEKIIDRILRLSPHGLVFEAANHRHSHEVEVWRQTRIPEEKVLIPGVLDTSSVYIEHPKAVAARITSFTDIVGRDRVIPGSDCGFASWATWVAVDPEIAWAKLHTLSEGARLATERLWP
ncbi:UNVERIFIED_ORG: 5-methyltetrahydropteroyltriglutamate--homocysteine methyltransferase [Dietzia maris]|uniref:cobalamin-independent methionine synthase II family protein n=1 Tax=Dietzia maris TaxID=37915 RepID=UPI00104883DA